ncbi:hypothetical protein M5U04_12810 [Xenorhabdus sp. XENO-1]|uniref:hypothetical protein n=1 Tax=Xenorhabdus bovienii TaxID=40576 RepID=UPI0020CA6027|nr:hypothetical protein [Xenorhabdus bovienii]MCP9268949.1 hypothetical protein [Xenorhabdus bovienii subsp. africana]
MNNHNDFEIWFAINKLYSLYNRDLDAKRLNNWASYLTDDCIYRVTSKQNIDNGWDLCFVYCEGKNMAKDRASALSGSIYFRDRVQQRIVSNILLAKVNHDGSKILAHVTTTFAIHESICGQENKLLVSGITEDIIEYQDNVALFKERLCICTPDIITDSIVYPI